MIESNSHGFRLGRKFTDATWRIRHKLKYDACSVFAGDIEKCFDNINHKILLEKLNAIHEIENQVKTLLEAGIFEKGASFFNLGKGTPQRGVISAFLANLASDSCKKQFGILYMSFLKNKKCAEKILFI